MPRLELKRFTWRAMGGPCSVDLWLPTSESEKPVYNLLKAEVERLEAKYSRYRPESWLCALNAGARVEFDDEAIGLLNYTDECHDISDGLFDPTVGILRHVWQFSVAELPESKALTRCLDCIGWKKLNWDGKRLSVPKGMELDFGGLVKEFAADRLANILQSHGYSGLVNLAGDIAASAPQPNKKPWLVAIKHPRSEGAFAKVPLFSGGLATSGDYERYITVNNRRYCHLLRPDTGYSALNSLASVTVLAPSCMMAGSVSSVALLKGAGGLKWLDEMALPYFAIDTELEFYKSTGS